MSKKRSFRGKPKKNKTKMPSQGNLMGQFQKMQEDMRVAQEALADKEFTVTAGGGAIEIVITGHQRIKSIKIDPDMMDPEDPEMLQDLLVSTVNQAIEESQTKAAEQMEGITGGMGDLGGMLGGLGGL